MKCLSVCQPFAELIIQGKKTIELRKWNTKFRGEFLVHAAKNILEQDCKFDDLFMSVNGQHPPILKMFLSKRINFETVLILDDILSFTKQLNKNISEKVLWPKLYDRMIRYKPFLNYNLTKYKMTLKRKLKL